MYNIEEYGLYPILYIAYHHKGSPTGRLGTTASVVVSSYALTFQFSVRKYV